MAMDKLFGIIAVGALFLSVVAYREVADILLSPARLVSPRLARAGGVCAAGLTATAWLMLCQGLGG
jgi:hypothetical protein